MPRVPRIEILPFCSVKLAAHLMGFICAKYFSLLLIEADFIKTGLKRKFIVIPGESNSKALIKLGNIVAENIVAGTWFLVHVILPGVAKLTENKQNVFLPRWLNEETLCRKTKGHSCAL